jgi:hypothetical protein
MARSQPGALQRDHPRDRWNRAPGAESRRAHPQRAAPEIDLIRYVFNVPIPADRKEVQR